MFVGIQYTNQQVWNEWNVFTGNQFTNSEGKATLASCLDLRPWHFSANFEHITIFGFSVGISLPTENTFKRKDSWSRGRRLQSHSYNMLLFGNPKILTLVPFGFVHMTMNEKRNKEAYFCLWNSIISPVNTVAKIADFLYILFLHHGQRVFVFKAGGTHFSCWNNSPVA